MRELNDEELEAVSGGVANVIYNPVGVRLENGLTTVNRNGFVQGQMDSLNKLNIRKQIDMTALDS